MKRELTFVNTTVRLLIANAEIAERINLLASLSFLDDPAKLCWLEMMRGRIAVGFASTDVKTREIYWKLMEY